MAISIYASDRIRRNTFPEISGSIEGSAWPAFRDARSGAVAL
jgi:hypothetical protein